MFGDCGRCVEHEAHLLDRRRAISIGRAGVRAGKQAEWPALLDVPQVNAVVAAGNECAPVRGEDETIGGASEIGEGKRFRPARALPEHARLEAAQVRWSSGRRDARRYGPLLVQEPAGQRQIGPGQRLKGTVDVRRIGLLAGGALAGLGARQRVGGALFLMQSAVPLAGHLRAHYQQDHDDGGRGDDAQCQQAGAGRVASGPFARGFPTTTRPGANRLVAQPAIQVFRQRFRRGVAMERSFLDALQADGFQIAIHLPEDRARPPGFVLDHGPHRGQRRVCAEWRTPCEQFIENRAQAVDVRGGGDGLRAAGGLLGWHVVRRAQHRAAQGQVEAAFDALGQAEVADERLALRVEEDVSRLQIAVQHAALMRVMDGAGHLGHQGSFQFQVFSFKGSGGNGSLLPTET